MTIATIDPKPKDKQAQRLKPAPKSDEQRATEKAERLDKKVRLNDSIRKAIVDIDAIMEKVAQEHGQSFEYIANMVHLGGRVYKDRRAPTIHNAFRFASARVGDGRWKLGDSAEVDEAIRIIGAIKDAGNSYDDLSPPERDTLLSLLDANRKARETGVVGKPQLQMQDVRTTIEKVKWELSNLHVRSKFEYYLIGSRSDVNQLSPPTVILSPSGGDFFAQYLKYDPVKLSKYFEAFCNSHAGLPGLVRYVASQEHKGDTKSAMKALIMPMLRRSYEDVSHRVTFKFDWVAFAEGRTDSHDVRLVGWPLTKIKPTALSNITTKNDMQKIFEAVSNNLCYFEKVDNITSNSSEGMPAEVNGPDNDTPMVYERGGTVLSLGNETNKPSKKTKRTLKRAADQENAPTDEPAPKRPRPRPLKRQAPVDASTDSPDASSSPLSTPPNAESPNTAAPNTESSVNRSVSTVGPADVSAVVPTESPPVSAISQAPTTTTPAVVITAALDPAMVAEALTPAISGLAPVTHALTVPVPTLAVGSESLLSAQTTSVTSYPPGAVQDFDGPQDLSLLGGTPFADWSGSGQAEGWDGVIPSADAMRLVDEFLQENPQSQSHDLTYPFDSNNLGDLAMF